MRDVWRVAVAGLVGVLAIASTTQGSGQEYRFDFVPASSNVEIVVAAVGLDDSDSSPVSGFADVVLTPAAGPFTEVHINVLRGTLTDTLTYNLSAGFLGGVDATGQNIEVLLGDGFGLVGPPAPVDGGGDFTQANNYVETDGQVEYDGYGIVGGGLGGGTIDLTDLGELPATLPGTVVRDGSTITLFIDVNFSGSYSDSATGLTVDVAVTGTLVGTATVVSIYADIDGDGDVDLSDGEWLFAATRGPVLPPRSTGLYTPTESLAAFDSDADGDLDLADLAAVQRAITGRLDS